MKVEYDCIVCGKHVQKSRTLGNMLVPPKYCSQACHGKAKRGKGKGLTPNTQYTCKYCGKEVYVYRSPSNTASIPPKFCSLKCLGLSQAGTANPAYNGGRYIGPNGYVYIHCPESGMRDCRNYVMEHRLIMAKHLGRELTTEEVVHHINHNKTDNRIENLMLFANQSAHLRFHAQERRHERSQSAYRE